MARQWAGLLNITLMSLLTLQSCGSTDSSPSETQATTSLPPRDDATDLPTETTPPAVTSTTPPTSSAVAEQLTSTSMPADSATTTTIEDLGQPPSTLPPTTTSSATPTTSITGSGSSYTASPDDPFECTITIISAVPAPDGERQFDLRIESTSIRGTAHVRVSWENRLRNHLIPLSLGGVGMTRVAAGLRGEVEAVVFSAADFRPSSERCSASAP
ncbi:MAG: hypothetical protein O3A04_05500 [Actinomycetota bacterium]|nr:hypothetical protein [Actinomycetota bacterium]